MFLKFTLLRPNAKLPERKNLQDVGLDCYVPEAGVLKPGMNKVPLGWSVEIPNGYQGIISPRSGHAVRGILSQIPPIDPGYTGEVHALIYNATGEDYEYPLHERVGQLVITPAIIATPVLELENNRGNNGFNSTGR